MKRYITLPEKEYTDVITSLELNEEGSVAYALSILKDKTVRIPIVCPPVSQLSDVMDQVKAQVEYDSFSHATHELDNICLIIAEVLMTDPFEKGTSRMMKINGSSVNMSLVQYVYRKLTRAHIDVVMSNFKEITDTIRNKKAYMQTALYNSVYELDLHYRNTMQSGRTGF